MENRPFRHSYQVAIGLVVIALGAVLLLDRLDVLNARDYLRWWPVLLVAYGVSRIMELGVRQGRGIGWLFVFIGGALTLDRMDIIDFRVWDLWPLVFVFVGAALVWRALQRERSGGEAADSLSTVNAFAFWSGIERKNASQEFRGGELTAIMGGMEIDLRGAKIAGPEAVVDIFAFWGGIELRVPETWAVVVTGTPLMGGITDETRHPAVENPPRLIVRGTAIMGGAEIKN